MFKNLFNLSKEIMVLNMRTTMVNEKAPELRVDSWINTKGKKCDPLRLADLGDSYKILYCFQHWCSGCHSHGFPTLKILLNKLANTDIGFAAIQTVFEGASYNTFDKLRENQKAYALAIPFGHNVTALNEQLPSFMSDYQTGGTPWFVIIDPAGNIVYADFQFDFSKGVDTFGKEGKKLLVRA